MGGNIELESLPTELVEAIAHRQNPEEREPLCSRCLLISVDPIDRDQGHSQIPYFFEQSVQRGLVQYRAGEKRVTIFSTRDVQSLKPVCPMEIQTALDP